MRPTRRTQPYRKGLATKMMGPAHSAMTRGAPAGLQNPQDVPRTLAKRMSKIRIPNPLGAADDVWKQAAGPTMWPGKPPSAEGPPIQIAGTRRKRPKGRKPYER